MTDLNVMMREQARNGLQTALDAAVNNGDIEAARKASDDLAKLAVSTAPKAAPYVAADIYAALAKTDWYGVDPKKSALAETYGKTMDLKKFATAEAFAAALVKAVDEEFKPAAGADTEEPEEELEPEEETEKPAAGEKKPRKTDGPGEGEAGSRSTRRTSGPWTKLSDAPPETQKEIKRQADKMVGARATKEQRAAFETKALESHYATHLRTKGKK